MISAKHIEKYYSNKNETVHALADISIDFIDNGIVFIVGESGSGKSTLLRILAGIDKDYTGSVSTNESCYYVSSDYDLFNELTVLENLALTHASIARINKLTKKFNLAHLLNKKAKLLSNGEKQRIQLLKAILLNNRIILLDETVSALDHDNLLLVMNVLKRLSKNHLVIMVTHNDALLDDYADQIIQLADGQVIQNQTVNRLYEETALLHSNHSKSKRTLQKALYAYTKELFSFKILTVLLAIVITVTSSLTISFFSSVNSANQFKKAIETNNATLTAVPFTKADSTRNYYNVYPTTYKEYNNFYYQDIQLLIEQYPQIIAINPYYSFKFSELFTPSSDANDTTFIRDSIRYKENYPSFWGMVSTGEIEETDFIVSEAYYMDQKYCFLFSCSDNRLYAEDTSQVINNKVNVYTLVNDYANVIRLLHGSFGSQPNEIVVVYSLAEKLQKHFQLESMEQLLNHSFVLNVVRQSNAYSIERNYTELTNLNIDIDNLDEKYIHDPYESIPFTITGITEFNNTSVNNAYLTGDILNNPLLEKFLLDGDHSRLPFTVLNIMVKPDEDMELLKKEFNTFFHLDQSEFKLVSETLMVEATDDSYQINTPTIIISGLTIVISLIAYTFGLIKNRLKVNKTIILLDRMSYRRHYAYISQGIEYGIILLLSFGITIILQNYLNQFSHTFHFAQLMQVNPLILIGIATVVSLVPLFIYQVHRKS